MLLKGKKFKILKASYLNEHNEFGLLVKIGKNKLGIGLHLGTLVIGKLAKWKESQSWIVQASLMDKEET